MYGTKSSTTYSSAEDGKATSATDNPTSSTLSSKSNPTKTSSRPTQEDLSDSDSDDVTIQVSQGSSKTRNKLRTKTSNRAPYNPSKSALKLKNFGTENNLATSTAKPTMKYLSSTVKHLNEKFSSESFEKKRPTERFNGTVHATTKSSIIPKQDEEDDSHSLSKPMDKQPSGNSSEDATDKLIEDVVDMLFTNKTENNLDKIEVSKTTDGHSEERIALNKQGRFKLPFKRTSSGSLILRQTHACGY